MTKYWPFFILLGGAAALLFPVIFTGSESFFIKQDNLHQAYPWYNKLAIALHKGYLPVWDANTFGGKNFAGEPQTGIFYPVNIAWVMLFGTSTGIETYWLDLLVSFHYLICLFGMYKLGRVFELSKLASIAGSIVFTFAGAVGARAAGQTCIFFGLTWLPWGVYFIGQYLFVEKKFRYLLFAGIVGGLQILAGHFQPFFHTVMIEGIFILWYTFRGRESWIRSTFRVVSLITIIVGFAFIVSLPQVYYVVQYMARSYRAVSHGLYVGPGQKVPLYIYSHWFIIQPGNFLNLLGQHYGQADDDNILYMGVLPLLVVILYLVWFRKKKVAVNHAELTKILAVILAVGLISSMGYRTLFYFLLYHIPFFSLIRQLGRYIILISFSASLLLGLGINYLQAIREWLFAKRAAIKSIITGGIGLSSILAGLLFPEIIRVVVWVPFLLAAGFLWWLSNKGSERYWPVAAVAIIFIDLLLNPVDYLPARTYFYPDYYYGRNRIIDTLESTYGKYRIELDLANNALTRRNLGDVYAIQTKNGYGATINTAFSDFINRYPGKEEEVNDLLNVRYVITDKKLDSNFVYRDSVDYVKLYERRNWYPRYFWQHQLGEPGLQIEAENKSRIRQLSYSDCDMKLTVNCISPDTLIFSENYYPGWTCFDNGGKIEIYTAKIRNYPRLFRSISLDSGRHVIEFRYERPFIWF